MYLFSLLLFISFITALVMVYSLLKIVFHTRLTILERIKAIEEHKQLNRGQEPLTLSFKDRIILPFIKKLEKNIGKWTPASLKVKEQDLLKLAGYPHHLTLQEWMTWRMAIWFVLGILFTWMGINQAFLLNKLLITSIGWILGYIGPIFYLKSKKDERKRQIEKGLPYVIDILKVSVDAGLGFDAALVKVVEKTDGVLSEEFQKTLQEIKMGKGRKDALRGLGEKTGVEDMVQFVSAIIQAEQLGVGIGRVLRVQSEDMRQKKKQRAEEKAMKAPIKILFPLILFIFPAIFIIILGPAVINIMNNFMN